MRGFFSWCAAAAVVSLICVPCFSQQNESSQRFESDAKAGSANEANLKGRYAFTLSEVCVNQISANVPGFDSNLHLVDPKGAETYSGASDGFMNFDGKGTVTLTQGRATNIMNAANRLVPPIMTPIPLGFGLGGAIPFTCTGKYTVDASGKININPMTCTAKLTLPNVFNATGFISEFVLQGYLPQDTGHLVLTDIGDTVQPVTINFNTTPVSTAGQQRICTRAMTLEYAPAR